uniref:Uncharacterized protein n=1 Tax=Solanum lycopersicum TaxID=4081 RepID=A0A3Q7GJH3_SOLLC
MPNWELKHCCKHEQIVFLATLGVCAVVILALWRTVLLLPFKLVTVFIHEASHAIACKLTCGHVEGIQVHANEGGTTQTRGDIYDDLISRRVNSSDAEKFAEVCPCPCTGVGWGVIWGLISFLFLCGATYLSLVILS